MDTENRENPVDSPMAAVDEVKTDDTTNMQQNASDDTPEKTEGPKLLDLAFAMDCTGSMGSYIHQAQQNIRRIVEDIVAKEAADVRLALVEYRDHPPQDSSFVTRVQDFTASVREMKSWLDACSANGGGDGPEAVADALHQVLKLNWRQEATKICVFISDAPPHGLGIGGGDGFPNGCPDGLDPMEIAAQLTEKSITLYLVGCEPSINPYKEFFMALAHVTGGQYVPLGKASLLSAVIIGGAQEELSLQQLLQEVNEEVQQELQGAEDGSVSHKELSKRVHSRMKERGHRTKQLNYQGAYLEQASATAESLSYCANMEEVRKKMPAQSSSDYMGGYSRHSRGSRASKSSKKKSMTSAPVAAESSAPGGVTGMVQRVASGLSGWFGSSSESHAVPVAMAAPSAAAPAMVMASSEDVYNVAEDDIAEEQVQRLVQKSLMQSNMRHKVAPKKS